ncbi:MAG: restriction endonuclease subunit S, partial [ANME-2 cluster archaeon]|nr:restriction endonuclease subunit S [ANME-2 cluster archaeon]
KGMKQEIKERVEKIHNGEVPEGYRKTKVGIIPDDWTLDNLKIHVSSFIVPMRDKPKIFSGDIPWCRIEDFQGKYLEKSLSNQNVSKETIDEMNLRVYPKGTVLCSCSARLGICTIVRKPLVTNQTFIGLVPKEELDNEFLYYFMGFKCEKLQKLSSGTTISYLSREEFENFPITYTTLKEQKKIISIISTWDKAIELKEKLIEEKKEFKKGLMQKLLTGKIRFPEFTDEWMEIDLNKIVKKINNKNDEKNQTIVTISAKKGFVNQNEYFNKIVASQDLSNYYLIRKGDFAYNKSYSNGYPVGVIKRLESFEKAVVTTLYICFRIKNQTVSSNFLKYYFDSVLLNRQIKRIANEGGRAHGLLNVTPSDFFNIEIKIPDIYEQEKIADVLMSQDKKIHLMELTLEQLKEQKRGLMQLLLTGIVRVEVD